MTGAGRGVRKVAAITCGLICFASFAHAQGDVADQWARLARAADVIVAGECIAESSAWDDTTGVIVTTVEFRANRFYKGELARTLTIKTLGGRIGDESMAASHGATLAAGEQLLLFLKRSEFGSYFVVVGGESGKLAIDGLQRQPAGPTTGTRTELLRLLHRSATSG